MHIDFTKLANIAYQCRRKDTSNFLIGYEQSIVRKIPFLLQIGEHSDALMLAIASGDPNIIEKVFRRMFADGEKLPPDAPFDGTKLSPANVNRVIKEAAKITDGLRHLRNYAKKRGYGIILYQMMGQAEIHRTDPQAKNRAADPVFQAYM